MVKARDLKAGDVIEWEGKTIRVDSAYYADGRDGERPVMMTALPEHTKSAIAMKVGSGSETYLFHPAQELTK